MVWEFETRASCTHFAAYGLAGSAAGSAVDVSHSIVTGNDQVVVCAGNDLDEQDQPEAIIG